MRILFLLFLLSFQSLLGQELARYINTEPSQEVQDYFILSVLDSTKSQLQSELPKIRVFEYSSPTHRAVSKVIQNFALPNETAKPFLAVVKQFDVFDEKKGAYNYEGQINVEIDFHSIYDGDTTLFYSGVGGGTFNFQYRDKAVKDIGGFSKQVITSIYTKFENELRQNTHRLPAFNSGSTVKVLPFRNNYIPDTVFYQRGKVTWDLFKGELTNTSKFSAAIFPGFAFASTIKMKDGKIAAEIEPYVYMLPNLSWVKTSGKSDYSLAHEQLHFDIAFLACLKMIDAIKKVETASVKDLQSHIQYEYLTAYQFMNQMQKAYDDETNHGLNVLKQQEWSKRIEREIESLE